MPSISRFCRTSYVEEGNQLKGELVNAGEKMQRSAGVKMHHGGMPEGPPREGFFISVASLGLVVGQLSCLWLALASLALFQPIAVAVHFEDVDVVGQPVE